MKSKVIKQNAGNDISKDDFTICFYQGLSDGSNRIKGSRKFKNTLSGFKLFVDWIEKKRDSAVEVRVCIEATGVYYEQLAYYLHEQTDYHVSVILPNKSKAYAQSLNIKSKTDDIDAKLLGQMGLERNLKKWTPLSPGIRGIKQLCRERLRLINQKTVFNNQLHALKHSYEPSTKGIDRLKEQLQLVVDLIKKVEKELKNLLDVDEKLKSRIDKICQIKGVSWVTVATIIAETDGFTLFTSRAQLVSYCGYDVVEKQSGSSVKGKTHISKKGNKYIRRAMHFPALTIIKHEEAFKNLYDRVFERTAIKMKAYVAVQRKLLITIYALFKKNEAYDAKYSAQKKLASI